MPERFVRHRFVVGDADRGLRLDQLLAAHVPDLSRRKARALLDQGGVFVDGARTKVAGRVLKKGQVVVANVGGALERASEGHDEPAYAIVHEDAHLVVVDKPSGVLTAPTPEGDRGTLARALEKRFGTIFVVHRIDLETSGLLVFARTDDANRALSERFRVHDIHRAYDAVLVGKLEDDARTIDAPIGDRRALTRLTVIERFGDRATRVRAELETGRTHQIRIHAKGIGHAIAGDRRYGASMHRGPPRLALHAAELGFVHPATGEAVRFSASLPDDLARWLERLRAESSLVAYDAPARKEEP